MRAWHRINDGWLLNSQPQHRCNRRILTDKFTHRERFLQSFSAAWQLPRECKSLIIRVYLDCHGRDREFESRRPRSQKSYTNFSKTNEGAGRHKSAPVTHCPHSPSLVSAGSWSPEDQNPCSAPLDQNTNDKTPACAACFAGVFACV